METAPDTWLGNSGPALDPDRNDVNSVELLVADIRGIVAQQSEGEIFDCRRGGFVGQKCQLVFNVLLSRRCDKLEFHGYVLWSGVNDQARTLRGLGIVLLCQQADQRFLTGGAQPSGGGFTP